MTLDSFPFDIAPFDCLTPDERVLVRVAARAVTWPADTALPAADKPDQAWLLTTGHVQRQVPGEVAAVHGPLELVGMEGLLTRRHGAPWTTVGDVRAIALPRTTLLDLMAHNAQFAGQVYAQLARQMDVRTGRNPQREFVSLMMARIRDSFVRKPFYVDGGTDIVSVCRQLHEQGVTSAVVRDGERLGIFTTTDLRDALLRPEDLSALPVRALARFDLITISPDAELFDALVLMVRHRVHRLLVKDGDAIVGVLSQLDLMSSVSNHSHIIALQIDQATSVADLRTAALQMDSMVGLLEGGGVRIDIITSLVSELNSRVFERLWTLLAPPELIANSCLVVMGSEGRGEQILKTDQDNALLLRDGFEFPGLAGVAERFNAALAEFGYPPCPGQIMLTNPLWRQPLAAFRHTLRDWIYGADPDGPMHLAIFFDAAPVAGDASLLAEARTYLDSILADNDAYLARFAKAADQFQEAGTWWTRLTARRDEQPIDLKKLGTFPIVHGVRALSLRHGVRQPSTAQRLRGLVEGGHLDDALARDLVDALHYLMALRLRHQLKQRQRGEAPSNLVRPSDLGTLERDPLRDSLAIIKRFRATLAQQFKFDSI